MLSALLARWRDRSAVRSQEQLARLRRLRRPWCERLEDRTLPAVNLGTNFTGLGFPQSGGFTPPDTSAAVGPSQVIEVINTQVVIYNKATGAELSRQAQNTFFGGSGSFDAVVDYDDIAQRFVIITLQRNTTTQTSTLRVAISNNSTPTN